MNSSQHQTPTRAKWKTIRDKKKRRLEGQWYTFRRHTNHRLEVTVGRSSGHGRVIFFRIV